MAQEILEIVERGFTATIQEDWDTALGTLHPEAEIYDFDVPDAEIYRGHDGYFAWLERWSEGWETWRVEDLEVRAAGGDQAVALFRMVATGQASGIEVERLDAITYRILDDKIVRMAYYNDQQQALEAVGLDE
jgi:ketosteroid isomerase-like protein